MTEFIVELYVSRNGAGAVAESASRARQAAEQMTREGATVRFLRTMFVPEDETCFYLYEAESEEAVREAAGRAALPVERVAKAMTELESERR
jgi:uncharacterized protein DUF4242